MTDRMTDHTAPRITLLGALTEALSTGSVKVIDLTNPLSGDDVASLPPPRLVGPAVVLDFSEQAAADPDWCSDQ